MKKQLALIVTGIIALSITSTAQVLSTKNEFTKQDTLRGTINENRSWWDVQHYAISVIPDIGTKSIRGVVDIIYKNFSVNSHTMQIDLQEPMNIEKVEQNGKSIPFKKDGNVYLLYVGDSNILIRPSDNSQNKITITYSGTPRPAKNAPWDGGWIWKTDEKGRPWVSVAVQGLGASAWFPCKDHQSDEPDNGASLTIAVPDTLVAVANGKLANKTSKNGLASYTWEVKNPINNYNIIPYIGKYVNFTETFNGEKGKLTLSYWVLDYNLEKAKKQFAQAPMTIKAFEHWFGPFPWYEDDFKLVEAPHLGMEHQSAVAYGNKYQNGYLGRDLSGTGVGKKWDFIIVHEVGHEWFGNNITTKDIADMWVHEGFTNYSETLFTEYHFGKSDAEKYVQGLRKNIANDKPIIGPYGVNHEGSSDMYYKGANMLHTVRQVINDDKKFRNILRGLNKVFYHQTVTTQQVEQYISKESGKDFQKIFDQYLRTTKIPVLKLHVDKNVLRYKWDNTIVGFAMPVKLTDGSWIYPTNDWRQMKIDRRKAGTLTADPNFYIVVKKDD